MFRGSFVALLVGAGLWAGLVAPVATAGAQAQTPAAPLPKDFKPFTAPGGRFFLAYPKNWQLYAGARDLAVTIADKDAKAVVVIQLEQKADPAPETIDDIFAGVEARILRERQPDALNVLPSLAKDRPRLVILDYGRIGLGGGAEQLRQYSYPEDRLLVRITCIASAKEFARYEKLFATLASTVRIPAPASSPAFGSH